MARKRGTCPECNREDMAIMARGMCASCYTAVLRDEKVKAATPLAGACPGNPTDPLQPLSEMPPGALPRLMADVVSIAEAALRLAEDATAAGEKIADCIKPLRLRYIELRHRQTQLGRQAQEISVASSDDDDKEA
ncbi:MAG TPA: hypothetical protein VM223_01425 [Planctomycetota bacterium]|nr:hypothetical protein [Planctomycetota bacterium]